MIAHSHASITTKTFLKTKSMYYFILAKQFHAPKPSIPSTYTTNFNRIYTQYQLKAEIMNSPTPGIR